MRRERIMFALIVFVIVLTAVLFGSVKAYSDGWKAGFEEAEQQAEAHYKHMEEIKEITKEAEQEPVIVPIRVEKLPEQRKFGNSEQLKEQEHSASEWWSEDDVFCLAAVIYQEAGGDACSDETRRMVADVVLNRVFDNRFPNTIREVLEDAPGGALQYGRFALTGVCFPAAADAECEQHAVERAFRIANEVLDGEHSELFENGYIWQAEFAQGSGCVWQDGICFGKG
ncbi:MAG: cell wall hydrolase [Methanocorpusculum sp.]|nr:cell wall hydrolase [Methanocorpusculum sp.]